MVVGTLVVGAALGAVDAGSEEDEGQLSGRKTSQTHSLSMAPAPEQWCSASILFAEFFEHCRVGVNPSTAGSARAEDPSHAFPSLMMNWIFSPGMPV